MKIAPGIKLNLTKKGISARVGPKGAGVTIGTSGTTVSAGIPGSGLHVSQKVKKVKTAPSQKTELLSNLVFEGFGSCGDLVGFGGFNSVFERDACDDFGEIVKAA